MRRTRSEYGEPNPVDAFGITNPGLFLETALKLGLAALLGGIVGWERERAGRPAGVRTHMLIVVGSTLMTDISINFGHGADPSRIAAQIVSGVGFLGAGTILRRGGEVKGLTSAASIWIAAAIGMAVGLGGQFYAVAVVATVLTIITLVVVEAFTSRILGYKELHELHLTLTTDGAATPVFGALASAGLDMAGFERSQNESGTYDLIIKVGAASHRAIAKAVEELSSLPQVSSVFFGGQ